MFAMRTLENFVSGLAENGVLTETGHLLFMLVNYLQLQFDVWSLSQMRIFLR